MPEQTDDNKPPEGRPMSQQEERIAEYIAGTVVHRIMQAATNKENAGKIMDVWSDEIDRTLGRGLRRLLLYILIALAGIAGAKLGLFSKLLP